MQKTLCLFLFLSFISINNYANAKITFSKECESEVVKLINESQETIDIAVYSINNENILNALYEARERGVKIKILTDRLQAFGKSSKVGQLNDDGFEIKVHSKYRIMHHKFAIFDNNKAVEGSFNWTYSASNKNAEDCNIFDTISDAENIKILRERFDYLWLINTDETSKCYLNNMKLSKEDRVKCNQTSKDNKKNKENKKTGKYKKNKRHSHNKA